MNTLWAGVKFAFGMLLVLHGFAHSPAILEAWKLKTYEDISYRPNYLLEYASDTVVYGLGFVWLIAAGAFIVAGLGVIRRTFWWPHIATFATIVSFAMTILWKEDAIVGLALNAGLLVVLIAILASSAWNTRHGSSEDLTMPSHV